MRSSLNAADIDRLIAEDLPHGDLTTHTLSRVASFRAERARIQLYSRDPMTVCGTEEAQQIFAHLGIDATIVTVSGRHAVPGALLVEAEGPADALFCAWKLAQTLIEWSSGVASAVTQMLAVAHTVNPATSVACTRKTVPFTRALSVKAVRAGGGIMHRMSLSDSILIFPEHLQFADTTSGAVDMLDRLRDAEPERAIVVEVTTVEQALSLASHVDVLQLEKLSVTEVRQVVEQLQQQSRRPVIAVAGGIRPDNAVPYVMAGAQVLVTSWPYQAAPRDVQVKFFGF